MMVIGVIFSGVAAGMATAIVTVAAGHPIETVLLAYMTAGLMGSLGFVAMVVGNGADVSP